ncbi:nucleotidyltransferase substrate binding protein (TIGR01987 family) [Anoxybacillus vitaminiphilus]|uniref:Nucleotidyltransferase substrate binding protein (TIGR01987 family) n=1 Tax=Paranoxybacillus vitaminiphilus TaxID=581036 RepID=A0A327YFN7_9BACL|nr:HI0074 family nucleotidyltransferase substrate-binding subunit [Anoxybacillus vitaminiphilus]RAK19878.1 nucleotidyltransferase substrate binding protein (TIGR01987 family) [Anoxybacillus vitaminiphilus]
MAAKRMYGLSEADFYKIINILKNYAPIVREVILFGSRARGDYKKTSDIDLAIKFRKEHEQLCCIRDALSEASIIYTIDVIDYDKINNEKLKRYIDEEGKVIFLTNEKGEPVVTLNKVIDKLADLERALKKLHESVQRDASADDLVRDGVIQRFEFTYELSWKLMKVYLEYNGNLQATNPRSAIREAFKEGLIEQGDKWIQMLEDRNRTSHTYDEAIAIEIYENIKQTYVTLFADFVTEMKRRMDH